MARFEDHAGRSDVVAEPEIALHHMCSGGYRCSAGYVTIPPTSSSAVPTSSSSP